MEKFIFTAFITDNEQYAVIATIQDGEQIVDIGDGHALLRLNWLKKTSQVMMKCAKSLKNGKNIKQTSA